jgi:hypothetical protein
MPSFPKHIYLAKSLVLYMTNVVKWYQTTLVQMQKCAATGFNGKIFTLGYSMQ